VSTNTIPHFGFAPADYQALPFAFEMTRLERPARGRRAFAHRHTYLHLLWVVEGSGVHVIDTASFAIRPGAVFFVAPRQVHYWQSDGTVQGYSLKLSVEFFERWVAAGSAVPAFPWFAAQAPSHLYLAPEFAAAQIPALDALLARSGAGGLELTGAMLRVLMLQLREEHARLHDADAGAGTSVAALARQFAALVDLHFLSHRKAADYAALLHTTPARLAAAVKEATGQTPAQLLAERMLLEAKRRLMFSDVPVAQLADDLGFEDPSYFARFFRNKAQLSPVEFRRRAAASLKSTGAG
jgi:AraC-like DNA-binding protein